MSWLDKLLGKKETANNTSPNGKEELMPRTSFAGVERIRFGRYSDNNKSQTKTRQWYAAEDHFKEKNYSASFAAFFDYLKDDEEQNVQFSQQGDRFSFTLLQGSKKIYGDCDGEVIIAKSPLAEMQTPGTAIMRRMLEMNYSLYYSHSALDEGNTLYMTFCSEVSTANPSKLYYGLRELATKADRQDDLLITDFPALKETDTDHIEPLPAAELDIKYHYFRKWIEETLLRVDSVNQDSFSGAIAYCLLALIYRIDFLIVPEAKLLSELEKIHTIYWGKKDDVTLVERNQMMKDAIRKLLTWSKEEFATSVYRSKSTFAITTPPKAEKVKDHISGANRDSQWYIEHKYPELALIINEYGIVYNPFIYSMPKVQSELIKIYLAIVHADYFTALGLKDRFYDEQEKKFNHKAIETAVDEALNKFRDKYRSMHWDHGKISYQSLYDFGISFSDQLASLNLETKRD